MTQSDPFSFLDTKYLDSAAVARPRYQPADVDQPDLIDSLNDDDYQPDDSALALAFEKRNAQVRANATAFFVK